MTEGNDSGTKRIYTKRESAKPSPVENSGEKKAEIDWENPTEFEILDGVPIPWTRARVKDIVFPFEGMQVGNSFLFMRESHKSQNVYSASVSFCRQPENLHKSFVIRKISEDFIDGVKWTKWGCWREEDLTDKEIKVKQDTINAKQKKATQNRRARNQL